MRISTHTDGATEISRKPYATSGSDLSGHVPPCVALLCCLPAMSEDDGDDDDDDGPKDKKAGRRKIKIEFIQDKSRRHITFSKRKAGQSRLHIHPL